MHMRSWKRSLWGWGPANFSWRAQIGSISGFARQKAKPRILCRQLRNREKTNFHMFFPQTLKNVKAVLTHKSSENKRWAEFGSWTVICQSLLRITYLILIWTVSEMSRVRHKNLSEGYEDEIVGTEQLLSKYRLLFLSSSPSASLVMRWVRPWVLCRHTVGAR